MLLLNVLGAGLFERIFAGVESVGDLEFVGFGWASFSLPRTPGSFLLGSFLFLNDFLRSDGSQTPSSWSRA